ncbi:hypothetical protein LTR37_007603 [Vermiconidia calcicola]|uniref:Uncharacterized protein n=1 Tax=Vermiconidia calcicola TaxID=1690605 RepID=A0ACC3ND79_9PEZI|nr:hypothetical protein LTR37_007603 [Vermiconidia calcicola]
MARINKSVWREEIIAALLQQRQTSSSNQPVTVPQTPSSSASTAEEYTTAFDDVTHVSGARDITKSVDDLGESEDAECSPFTILAAVVCSRDYHSGNHGRATFLSKFSTITSGQEASTTPVDHSQGSILRNRQLAHYFSVSDTAQKDWDVLAKQSRNSAFYLDIHTCDPLAAGIIYNEDVKIYFDMFYAKRNALVGLMDPALHTPAYVHASSFTLFSAICALGAAVSIRPKDRALHPVLSSFADQNIKWSISNSVKSLENIQAIILAAYWAPACTTHAEDPTWLQLGHESYSAAHALTSTNP